MTKKRIIIGVIIALLLVVGIGVNIVALKMKEDNNQNNNQVSNNSTNSQENVESDTSKNEVKSENVITEDDLELNGEPYKIADAQDKDGNSIALERQLDKPMVILFWNNEEAGLEVLKMLQNNYEKYSDKIIFSAVSVVDKVDIENIEKQIADNNITILNVYDTEDGSVSKANNVDKLPTIVAINKNGEIINTVTDEINEDIIEANLDIIAENY